MNRVSRLLHKIHFLARQRRAVKYSYKYVITAQATKKAASEPQYSKEEDSQAIATKLLDGFDPANNQHDRLILYEVTGMRLRRDEFRDQSSSNSENDEFSEEILPIDYAFMERFNDEEDETGQQAEFSYALNP